MEPKTPKTEKPPLPPLPDDAPQPGSIWRHFRGTHYVVFGVARHSEDLEPLVIYREPASPSAPLWARPLSYWRENVGIGARGGDVYRFTRVPDAD